MARAFSIAKVLAPLLVFTVGTSTTVGAWLSDPPDFLVPQNVAGDQFWPKLAPLGNGRFVTIWNDIGRDGSDWGVFARVFNRDGTPFGNDFQVNQTTSGPQEPYGVASTVNGDFMVVYRSTPVGQVAGDLLARAFSADGVPLGGELVIRAGDVPTNSYPQNAAIAAAAPGTFVISWDFGPGLMIARVTLNGTLIGSTIDFSSLREAAGFGCFQDWSFPVSLAADPQGNFLIAWASGWENPPLPSGVVYCEGDQPEGGIRGQLFDTNGLPIGSEFQINAPLASTIPEWPVATWAGNDFVIAWAESGRSFPDSGRIHAARVSSSGVVTSEIVATEGVPANTQSQWLYHTVAAAADGSWVFAWTAVGTGLDDLYTHTDVYARRFDANNSPAGPELRVNTQTRGRQDAVSVLVDDQGFVASWNETFVTSATPSNDGSSGNFGMDGVFARRIRFPELCGNGVD